MPDDRLFSDKEISALLKRASELQHKEAPETTTTGLSIDELRQVAEETGIDPRFVEQAAAEMATGAADAEGFHWLGGPTSVMLERIVEGELSVAQQEDVMEAIRQAFHHVGTASTVGNTLEWTYQGRRRQAQVRVTSHGGHTRLRVFTKYPMQAAPLFAISASLAILVGALVAAPIGGVGGAFALIAVVLAAILVARFAFGAIGRQQKDRSRVLLDKLEKIIAETPAKKPVRETPATGRLDVSALDEEAESESESARQASRQRTRGAG